MFKNNEVSQVMGIIPCKIPHNLTIFPLFCLLDSRFKKNYELFLKKVRNFFLMPLVVGINSGSTGG